MPVSLKDMMARMRDHYESQVNNWAYTRYNMIHPEIALKQSLLEGQFIAQIPLIDSQALEFSKKDPAAAVAFLTRYSVESGNKLVSDWQIFYHYLFMKYHDGNLKITEGEKLLDNGNLKNVPKKPLHPGYGKEWERMMFQGTGDRLKVPKE